MNLFPLENRAFTGFVKTDPTDRLEIEVGDVKQPDFFPQVKIKRWDNEVNASFRLLDDEPKTLTTEGEKVKLIGAKKEVHLYDIAPCKEHPEGGFEFEVILKEKPASNVIEFSLVDKDVEYFYQPPLNQEPLPPDGVSATETDVFDKDGKVIAHRPENVVGSYAVYTKTPKTNWVGGKKYKCGKVGHIYRPQIIDSAGKKVWGELHIENGILSVTIPQEFLDKAIYPVRHATGLTFGYTSKGGNSVTVANNQMRGGQETSAADAASAVSLTAWISKSAGATTYLFKAVLVLHSDSTILTNGIGAEVSVPSTTSSEKTSTFGTAPTLSASTDYVLCVIASTNEVLLVACDDVTGYTDHRHANNYATPTNPTFTHLSNVRDSIYCTYEAGAAGIASLRQLIGVGQGTRV